MMRLNRRSNYFLSNKTIFISFKTHVSLTFSLCLTLTQAQTQILTVILLNLCFASCKCGLPVGNSACSFHFQLWRVHGSVPALFLYHLHLEPIKFNISISIDLRFTLKSPWLSSAQKRSNYSNNPSDGLRVSHLITKTICWIWSLINL